MLVPFENKNEAHYVCSMLNSSPSLFIVKGYAIGTQLAPHILDNISIAKFDEKNGIHNELANLSEQCHEKVLKGIDVSDLEEQIDKLADELWGLTKEDLKDIKDSLEELK